MKYRLLAIAVLFPFAIVAQEILTLENAIEIALKNNYSIIIAKNQQQIAINDASFGNAGMLPQISLNASQSYSNDNTKQEYSSGTTIDKQGVISGNTGAGIALSWTIFDGMKMFATYDRLKEISAMGELSTKMQIENTLEQIITLYYNIVQQKQLLMACDTTIAMYTNRVKIADEKYKLGNGSKSDLLQAQVDLNEQKSMRLKQRNSLLQAKTTLNQVLSRNIETEFDVNNTIEINTSLTINKDSTLNKNNSILYYNKNISAFEYSLREIKAQQMPELSFNSSYNFSRTKNQAGFYLLNQNIGFYAGLTATWNLFNGFNSRRQIKNTRILLDNSKLMLENAKSKIGSELQASYNKYQLSLEALKLEEENVNLAKENANIMLERFKLSNATTTDLKTAQKSYSDALTRLIETRYETKIAETSLKKLMGELIK